MSNLRNVLILVMASLGIIANGQAEIKGKFVNCATCDVRAILDRSDLHPEFEYITASPDQYRNFVFDITDIHRPEIIILEMGSEHLPVYLEPNVQVWLRVNQGVNGYSFSFTGDLANENRHLQQYFKKFDLSNNQTAENAWNSDFRLSTKGTLVADLSILPDSLKYTHLINHRNLMLADVNKVSGLKTTYFSYMKQYSEFASLAYIFAHLQPNELTLKQTAELQALEADMVFNETNRHIPSFIQALKAYAAYKGRSAGFVKSDFNDYFNFMRNNLNQIPLTLREDFLIYELEQKVEARTIHSTEPVIMPFVKTLSSLDKMYYVMNLYNEAKTEANGMKAPDFRLLSSKGKSISLKDLKGKNVYLAFWSTTCRPCIDGMNKSISNKQHLKGEDIVFVYVSTDPAKSTWQGNRYVRSANKQNLHLWAGLSATETKAYNAISLPTYYFIDKKGNFVSDFPNSWEPGFVDFVKKLR